MTKKSTVQEDENVTFVFSAYPSYRSFTTYKDKHGNIKAYYLSKDSNGNPIPAEIVVKPNQRMLTVSKKEQDIFGTSKAEFIKNSPHCRGSATSRKRKDVYIKVHDPKKIAKEFVDKERLAIKAQSLALSLEGDNLRNCAAMYACFSSDVDLQRKSVVYNAKNNPERFLADCDKDMLGYRGIYQYAKYLGIIYQSKLHWYYKPNSESDPTFLTKGPEEALNKYLVENPEVFQAINTIVDNYAQPEAEGS